MLTTKEMMKGFIVYLTFLCLSASEQLHYICHDPPTYYIADGFDAAGGDAGGSQEFNSYAEALAGAKSYINGDKSKSALL